MADQSDLNSGENALVVDQAVFMSLPSRFGEGYAVVGHTPGVKPEERAEMTRRSPSHGALCDSGLSGCGIVSFPLTSGRICVEYVVHAGREHTGRGGYRVYSHALVLDAEAFRRFGCNPVRVAVAQSALHAGGPDLELPSRLPRLSIDGGNGPEWAAATDPSVLDQRDAFELVGHVAGLLTAGKRAVAVGGKLSLEVLDWALVSTPLWRREQVGCSVGVRFALSRGLDLCVLCESDLGARRLMAGQDIDWVEGSAPVAATGGWARFVADCWSAGHHVLLARLTGAMTEPVSLERVAASAAAGVFPDDADPEAVDGWVDGILLGRASSSPAFAAQLS